MMRANDAKGDRMYAPPWKERPFRPASESKQNPAFSPMRPRSLAASVSSASSVVKKDSPGYCNAPLIPRFHATNDHSSAVSSMIFEIGFPPPCPARPSQTKPSARPAPSSRTSKIGQTKTDDEPPAVWQLPKAQPVSPDLSSPQNSAPPCLT